MKYIIGLNFSHDASVTVLKDGKILGIHHMERLNRFKHDTYINLPIFLEILKSYDISLNEIVITATDSQSYVDGFGFHDIKDNTVEWKGFWDYTIFDKRNRNRKQKSNKVDLQIVQTETLNMSANDYIVSSAGGCKFTVKEEYLQDFSVTINGVTIPFIIIKHHAAHVSSAFYISKLKDALGITVDGGISYENKHKSAASGYYKCFDNKIEFYHTANTFVGSFYSNMSAMFLDSRKKSSAAKSGVLMAAAGLLINKVRSKIKIKEITKEMRTDANLLKTLSRELQKFSKSVNKKSFITQAVAEHELLRVLKKGAEVHQKRSTNIVAAGGVFLNCPNNTNYINSHFVEDLYIPYYTDDSGLSTGAALYYYHNILDNPLVDEIVDYNSQAYHGYEFTTNETEEYLKSNDLVRYIALTDEEMIEQASEDIKNDLVIGWVEGKSEAGPRALGHRSILGNPTSDKNLSRINGMKERQDWRPFAPMVLRREWSNWFEGTKKEPLKWMLNTLNVKNPDKVPAITHADGTARVQLVDKQDGLFSEVLEKFFEKTGVPIFLNTSFNGNEEPIVESPKDAVKAFLELGLDVLYINGIKVLRR